MGCKSFKKSGFKGGFKKKAWGNWKEKWIKKKSDQDERDGRKDDFEKKIIKFNCDDGFKFKKFVWISKDGDGWKLKESWKKAKRWKRDEDDDGGQKGWKKKDWLKKDHDKKYDWKKFAKCGCDCDEEEEHPDTDGPIDQAENRAPTIVAPTKTQILIDQSAQNQVISKVEATDLDGDTLVFKINDASDADSPDADSFIIDPQTGEITMTGVPSVSGSADGDWSYQIEVEVTDGQATDSIILDMLYFASA